jgi:hypothetical protein
MATRSRIGIMNTDGTIESVYCHFDGYLTGVGRILYEHYKDEDKVRELINLGDMSSLGTTTEFNIKHITMTFAEYANLPKEEREKYTKDYHRWRGEKIAIAKSKNETEFLELSIKTDAEYAYLFNGSFWLYVVTNKEKDFKQLNAEKVGFKNDLGR